MREGQVLSFTFPSQIYTSGVKPATLRSQALQRKLFEQTKSQMKLNKKSLEAKYRDIFELDAANHSNSVHNHIKHKLQRCLLCYCNKAFKLSFTVSHIFTIKLMYKCIVS